MTEYNEKTEDNFSRQIKPVLYNTAKDGSGTWYFPVVDSDGNLVMGTSTNVIGKVDHNVTGVTSGSKAVTTAGTAVKLVASSTPCKRVDIQGLYTNTSYVAVGGADVNATPATQKGLALSAGGMYSIACDDAFDLYVDSAVNGEGIAYNILT